MMIPAPFNALPPDAMRSLTLGPGERLFSQGDTVRGPFYLKSGEVTLLRHTEAGRAVVLHRAKATELFAEASVFSQVYHCDGVTVTAARIVALDKTAILARLQQDPVFATALLRLFAAQVQNYRQRLEILAIPEARARVLSALSLWGQQSTLGQFAADLGLSPEATSRAMSSLCATGEVQRLERGRYGVLMQNGDGAS